MRLLLRISGDICTKARRTRHRFTTRLAENVADALRSAGLEHSIERTWSRLYVDADDPEAAAAQLVRVFGIHSVSAVEERSWSRLDDIVRDGAVLLRDAVAGRRFAVRARRGGALEQIPFDSQDVERELGTALLPGAAGVDLSNPQVTANVEIHPGRAFYFTGRDQAPGGLPLAVEGRALALVSGGFDSAVAAWLLLKRGVGLDYLFFNLGGAPHQRGVLSVMRQIAERWSYGDRPRLFAVDFRNVAHDLQANAEPRYWQVLLKRLMLRAAERMARRLRLPALVTGEAVGQVSSQTLHNLAVLSQATDMPILRPLVGFNKDEIIERARDIGTYEASAVVDEYCALLPRHPVTAASLGTVVREEAKLDAALLDAALVGRSIFDLRELSASERPEVEIAPEEVTAGATVIDLRSPREYQEWHYPGALSLDYQRALRGATSFDPAPAYVLYCEHGLKSAVIAELMREAGFRAHHVAGGADAIRRATEGAVAAGWE